MSTAAARKLPYNCEVIRKVKMMSPRPGRRHATVASRLGARLIQHFDGPTGQDGEPGGWVIRYEPELHLEREGSVIPDLAGWREERAPEEDNEEAAYFTAPDWVCEVLSRSTAKWDRYTKLPLYEFHRVGHVWIVDPIGRQIEVFANGPRGFAPAITVRGEEAVRLAPFEATELPLSRIWPRSRLL
jgi:Uma2 family endonuclease